MPHRIAYVASDSLNMPFQTSRVDTLPSLVELSNALTLA